MQAGIGHPALPVEPTIIPKLRNRVRARGGRFDVEANDRLRAFLGLPPTRAGS